MGIGHIYFPYVYVYVYVFVRVSLCTIFLFTMVCSIVYNATVSLDGKGDFTTVGAAIRCAPSHSISRFYIHVQSGTYYERVEVPKDKTFIVLIGDSPLTTTITDNRSNVTGFKTSDSATITVRGDNFMAQSITFENSAGPQNNQAVAVLDEAGYTSYYKCRFLGFQDTLYVKGKNQFFKECSIYGTVDFIFGDGLVVFQDCNIYARLPNRVITVTAQSKDNPNFNSGFSFLNCTITSSPEITSNKSDVHVYLGRPWRQYSKVVFIECYMDDSIMPEGWMKWDEGMPLNNLFYGEFQNRGPGADVTKRISWPGYRVMDSNLALQFTVDNYISGSEWLPETGVPFRRGLLS